MPCHAKAHLWFPPPCTRPLLPWLAHHYHYGLVIATRHLYGAGRQCTDRSSHLTTMLSSLQRKCSTPRLFAQTAVDYQLAVVNTFLWSLYCVWSLHLHLQVYIVCVCVCVCVCVGLGQEASTSTVDLDIEPGSETECRDRGLGGTMEDNSEECFLETPMMSATSQTGDSSCPFWLRKVFFNLFIYIYINNF